MPAGDGLVQPSSAGPAQREGQAGAGDQPGGVLPGEAGEPGGLGDGQLDGGDAQRARLPAVCRDGRVAEGYQQVSVAGIAAGRDAVGVVLAVADCGQGDAAGQRAPDESCRIQSDRSSSTAAALGTVSCAKVPGVADVILLRDGQM
jgi:hypothetical protein